MKRHIKILLAIAITAFFIYLFLPGYIRQQRTKEALNEYREKNEKLKEENLILKKEVWALRNDPFYIEKMTRKELGYTREGEVIYEIEKKPCEDSSER